MKINQGLIIRAESKSEFQELLDWLSESHPHLIWVTDNKNSPDYQWDQYFRPQDCPENDKYILCINEDNTMFFRNRTLNGESYIEDVIEDSRYPTKFVYAQEVTRNITPPSKSDLMEFLIGG